MTGCVEVLREPVHVDRRRGDDQLEVGPPRQQPLEVAEQEVDVEARSWASSMMIVSYFLQHPVALQLGEQDAVGHQLDPARPATSGR